MSAVRPSRGAPRVATRIRTPRLLLRPLEPDLAPAFVEAIGASLAHLRAWLRWAQDEPETVEEKRLRFEASKREFDRGESFGYAVLTADGRRALGGAGLMPRIGPGGLEIGYWLRADAVGRGFMSEAAAALTRVAFEVQGVDRVEIHMDPRNVRSAAVPRRLGFTHVENVATAPTADGARDVDPRDATDPIDARSGAAAAFRPPATEDGGRRETMIWRLDAGAYASSPLRARVVHAFDARGERLL